MRRGPREKYCGAGEEGLRRFHARVPGPSSSVLLTITGGLIFKKKRRENPGDNIKTPVEKLPGKIMLKVSVIKNPRTRFEIQIWEILRPREDSRIGFLNPLPPAHIQ